MAERNAQKLFGSSEVMKIAETLGYRITGDGQEDAVGAFFIR